MKTPIQYKNQLTELGIDQIKTDGESQAEAENSLSQLAEILQHVKDIETSLNMDIHALRSQFQGRIGALSINQHHKSRVEEEQRVVEERDTKLAPYEEVKSQLQTLLAELEEKKANLEKLKTPGNN